ncbi:MAG: universal stress protein [Alphaproteobacteria bacterium]|nr:universal stress protein [Alphaproteobacteria bacterium]
MAIKSILVPLQGAVGDRTRLDLALAVARPAAAHVRALFTRPDPRAVLGALYGDAWSAARILDEIEADGVKGAARARETFQRWCAANDLGETMKPGPAPRVVAEWCERIGGSDEQIAAAGGAADLIVMSGLGADRPALDQIDLEAALFTSGRPVLIAAPTVPADLFATAIVAWNGSPEANRAVAAALPLLAACGRVGVFCEPEAKRGAASVDELIAYLARHGVKAARVPAGPSHDSAPAQLLDAGARINATLIVMGAYTHGRLRQMVFGGVTQHVLHHATIPALLAH